MNSSAVCLQSVTGVYRAGLMKSHPGRRKPAAPPILIFGEDRPVKPPTAKKGPAPKRAEGDPGKAGTGFCLATPTSIIACRRWRGLYANVPTPGFAQSETWLQASSGHGKEPVPQCGAVVRGRTGRSTYAGSGRCPPQSVGREASGRAAGFISTERNDLGP